MPSRRYHIHVICVAHSQPLVLDSLAVFFQSRAFLTHDISTHLAQSALYGRQCVDACDYVLILIGDSYGTVQNTGFSQMHLSYFNAKARAKPMMALIKRHYDAEELNPQLKAFTQIVEQQKSNVHYYDDNTDIKQLLNTAHIEMIKKPEVVTGWLSAKDSATSMDNRAANSPAANSLRGMSAQNNKHGTNNYTATDTITTTLELTQSFDIEYMAQAYEEGNLTDVTMTMTLTWQNVLQALGTMPAFFSSYGLQSQLNRLIASKAELDIKKLMPKVHAVARCQIIKSDLDKLQRLLIAANWIQIKSSGSEIRSTKELWSLTFYAKKLLEESQTRHYSE
ncbi:DUF4062 domain-containing protein [Psychrobacter sp. AH5]|uniref:DUF4062 domain-containing protein n=1 Tax=Psychrobacter sp. AH5 TaxID=2937433 RepID=UPI003341FE8E